MAWNIGVDLRLVCYEQEALRARKDRLLITVSNARFEKYSKPCKSTASRKALDVFDSDTSFGVEVKV